jgi:hypothetical protein
MWRFSRCDRHRTIQSAFCAAILILLAPGLLLAKHKQKQKAEVNPNDPTARLFQILDNAYGGKLNNLYVLADVYSDPATPDKQFQRVLRVNYDKNRFFGKFRIYVRSVAKLTPTQLQAYTPQQVYDFGETDMAKFEKINPGPFGGNGDLYLQSNGNGPLRTAPITDDVRQQYNFLLTKYILPAVQKKQ